MNPGSTGTGWRVSPADVERIIPFELLLDRIARECSDAWVAERRFLHNHPEPSGEEIQTTQFIADRPKAMGMSPQIPKRGVGVIADLKIGTPPEDSPIVAVRADIDGLRMHDRKLVDYASRFAGIAHACGHDAHTTVVLAAAELLTRLSQRLPESELPSAHLRFIFQPAEETAQGAAWMVEDGALTGVNSILGLHVDPTIPVGKVGIRYGVLTAQVDEVMIEVSGRGGHAARPQHTSDPVGTAAMLVSALYQSIPRRTDSLTPMVFSVGSIHGGSASNVIPDRVEITGTLRSTDRYARDTALNSIRQVCTGIAAATGNTIDVNYRSPLGSVINDVTVTSAIEAASIQVLGGENIVIIDRPSMGGEDFAVYIEQVRGAQFRLGCAGPAGDWPLLHSPVFDVEEAAIPFGARIMARSAMMLAMIGPESAACR